ncbi:MAG TPA: hypothetical protein EYP90_10545, partial [Chromatiaceae bacterium]|nr:hypothetical protein [Chromatiaceae bacterium]
MNTGKKLILSIVLVMMGAQAVNAKEDASALLNKAADSVPQFDLDPADLEDTWREWVNRQIGSYGGGVQDFADRGIVVSSGVAYVRTRQGQPGWNESRMMAYAQADLAARSRLVEFWTQRLTTARKLEVVDNAEFRDGVVQDMRDIGEIRRILDRWGRKSVRLTDALLDKLISLADEDYDPSEFNALPPERQKVVLEEMYSQSVKRVAAQTLTGVATVFTTESKADQEYQVLVGVIWSPKLEQLSWSIRNDAETPPKAAGNQNIEEWVTDMGANLLGMWGTRIMVDEHGDYNVVAFAQAGPPRTSPMRQASAIHRAKEVAENRARAMIA